MPKQAQKQAAEKAFENTLQVLLAPTGYVHDLGGSHNVLGDEGEIHVRHWSPENLALDEIEKLFSRYGYYLELIGGDTPVGRSNLYQYPHPPKKEKN